MGIKNRDGALFMATGIDNSGIYAGRREAMGIIKTMASEITSFDIFSGIGISAATAFASAAKSSYDFEKEFRKNMLEVATISTQVTKDMTGFMNQVMAITQEIPIKAPDAAKALYQIVSAGHDGADGMKVLEVAARSAIGGITDTVTAADAITTLINAYKMSADDAEKVSDQLFTTARLGKTTFGELGQSIAQVAPIAAAYGVEMDQVLAAVATLTKSGTPTAQAMTQIRASIIGTSKVLGDGAFNGRTFQEALEEIAQRAGGSESKLRELIPEVEAVNGVLGMTGLKAKTAAADLAEMNASAGATEAAFKKMQEDVDNQMTLLANNIQAALRPMGTAILKEVSEIAKAFNEAFSNGDLERSLSTLKSLLTLSAVAWGTYKVAVIAAMVAENLRYQSSLAHMQGLTKMQALLSVLKGKNDALTASLLKNPYALMAAAVAALGYGLYKLWTYQTQAQKNQEKLNKTILEFNEECLKEERSLNSLFDALKNTSEGTLERKKTIEAINTQYGKYLPNLLTEESSLGDINTAYKTINASLKEQIALKIRNSATDEIVTEGVKTQASAISTMRNNLQERMKNSGLVDAMIEEIKQTTDEFQKAGSTWEKAWQQAYSNVQRKYSGKIKLGNDFGSSMENYVRSVFDTEKATAMIEKQYEPFINKVQIENEKVEEAVSGKTSGVTVDEKILQKQKALSRLILESELKLQSDRIAIMQDGKDKRVLLADKEYKETLAAIEKERAEYKKGVKESGGKEDPSVLGTFDAREGVAKDKHNTDVININKESVREFADHQKQLSEILLSEEGKRLSSIKERYDKEREWANDQLKTGGMDKEQHEVYTISIDEAEAQESLKSLLDKYQDYDAKRREIEQRYTEEVQTLSSQRTEANKTEVDAAIAEAQKRHKEEAAALNFDEFKDTDLWSKMFGDLDKMALPTLQGILDKAKEVNTSTWSPENIKEYQDAITRLEEVVRTRSPFKSIENDWKKLLKALKEGNKDDAASAFAGIDTAVQKINTDLKTIAGGIGDIFGDEAGYAAEQVTELTSALGGFVSAASKFASGDILGGIASVVSSIGSIFSMGKKVKEINREAREENQRFYDEAKAGEIEYQALLRERLRITQQIGETSLQYFDRLQKELHAQSGSIGKEYEEVWSKLMGEEYISGKGYKHGTWFRKAKTWDEYSSLAGKSYEDIESLYTQNKLTDSAKVLFEQLQKLKEEGADVVDMMDDLNQSMKESWTGTTEDSIAQSILDGIAAGKNGVDDLTTYFRDMMKKAMLQGVNMKYLQEPIKKFYDQFADMSESGGMLTEGEIKELESMYQQIINNAQAQFDNLQKVSGLDFSKEENFDNTLKGEFAKTSQESIGLLAGQTGATRVIMEDIKNSMIPIREQMQAIREINEKGLEDIRAIRDLTIKIDKNSEQVASNTRMIHEVASKISENTRGTVDALEGTINVKVKMT